MAAPQRNALRKREICCRNQELYSKLLLLRLKQQKQKSASFWDLDGCWVIHETTLQPKWAVYFLLLCLPTVLCTLWYWLCLWLFILGYTETSPFLLKFSHAKKEQTLQTYQWHQFGCKILPKTTTNFLIFHRRIERTTNLLKFYVVNLIL